ncbi:MAG TPA: EamA family transporter RarD [Polyangia bacterium]
MTDPRARAGVLYAGGAFFIWGIVPLYFAKLRAVSPFEVIAHRVIWSVLFLAALVGGTGGIRHVRAALGTPRLAGGLAITSALVAVNWLTFVWAVNAGRVLETSLGYFITPQVNVLLGFLFLRERLRPWQWVAVGLAAAGVINQIATLGQLPWISLVLAFSFGCYGLLRKQIPVDSMTGLLVETIVAAPFAIAYLAWLWRGNALGFGSHGWITDAMLISLGVVTAVPLLLFAAGTQRLRLVTIGFLQYIAPTMTFLLAIFVFGETLGRAQVITFIVIWIGIVIYAADNVRAAGKNR